MSFNQYQETFSEFIINGIKTGIPAKIISYNSSTRKATVEILAEYITDTDETKKIPPLVDITCSLPVAGGFCLSFPYKAGDVGRLAILSHDIDEYKGLDSVTPMYADNNFSFNNSIFIPDFQTFTRVITAVSTDNLVIGLADGTLTLEMTPSKELFIQQNGVQKFKLNSDGTFDIIGNMNVDGIITCTNLMIGEKSVDGHIHGGVQSGGGSTAEF